MSCNLATEEYRKIMKIVQKYRRGIKYRDCPE